MSFTKPSRSDVHVNQVLTSVSIATIQDEMGFIASRAAPPIRSDNQSNVFRVYPPGAFTRSEARKVGPNTSAPRKNYEISSDNYFCEVRKVSHEISDMVRANADGAVNLDRDATIMLTHDLLIEREQDWANTYFTAGNPGDTWTFDVDGAATTSPTFNPTNASNNQKQFWDIETSTPIEDIRQGRRFVLAKTGFKPNKMAVSREVYDVLLDHGDIVDRLKAGQTPVGPAMANEVSLAALFGLDEILVTDAIANTAKEGAADNTGFILGKNALLYYAPPTASEFHPSAMYSFLWSGLYLSDGNGVNIKTFRMENTEADVIEARMAYDHKVISKDLGYFFGNIIQ